MKPKSFAATHLVSFVSGGLLAAAVLLSTNDTIPKKNPVGADVTSTPDSSPVKPSVSKKPEPVEAEASGADAAVMDQWERTRENLLQQAEQACEQDPSAAGAVFVELEKAELRESDRRVVSTMKFSYRCALIAARCRLPNVAIARLKQCLDEFGRTSGVLTNADREEIRNCYVDAASTLVLLLPAPEVNQVELWPFAQDRLMQTAPNEAARVRFVVPGVTRTYNDAILVLQSCREQVADAELQASFDRVKSALEMIRERWLVK